MPPIRVFVAEDNADLCDAIQLVLGAEADLCPVGAATSLDSLAQCVASANAQVVVLDIELQGKSSLQSLPAFRQALPGVRFIMFSGHVNPRLIEAALAAGACGYVSKSADIDELLTAIRASMTAASSQPSAASPSAASA